MVTYANCVSRFVQSDIRNPMFDKPGTISFSAGRPDVTIFPVPDIGEAFEVMSRAGELRQALQYGTTLGFAPLREKITNVVMKQAGLEASGDQIMITTGSQQGINFSAQIFINPGDTVIVETPTYIGALNAFTAAGAKCIGIPVDADGMDVEALSEVLRQHPKTKLIYTIPDFQNPTGAYMSLEKRKAIALLAEAYQVPVIEDAPYSEIRFGEEKLPPIKSFDKSGMVIYLSTFSKTLCPGFRLGWVYASKEILAKYILLKGICDSQSSTIDQLMAYHYLDKADWAARVDAVRKTYLRRRDVMVDAIKEYLPWDVSYTIPEGGFFVWLKFLEDVDTKQLLDKATELQVSFVPGINFFPEHDKKNYIRLSFSNTPIENIGEGIKRLGQAVGE